MPKEKNNTVEFLNEVMNNPDEVFKEEAVEKPQEEEIEDVVDEKPLPFNKDPKIQRFIEKQIEKRMAGYKPSEEQKFRKEVSEEIDLPPALIKLVGNDTPEKREALKELAAHLDSLSDKAQEKFIERMKEQENQQVQEDNAALEELNAGFESIEEEYGVDLSTDSKTRTAFVDYLRKVSHKNADGEVDQFADIPAAWEAFQERAKPQTASRAKELASRGMTRSTDTVNQAPSFKSGSRDPWQQVENHFAKLKNIN